MQFLQFFILYVVPVYSSQPLPKINVGFVIILASKVCNIESGEGEKFILKERKHQV